MATVNFKSACETSLSKTLPFENNSNSNNLRDASFSSYLNNTEEIFVRKLAEEQHLHVGIKKKEDDEEIGVFGAEKYFNGVIDEDSTRISSMGTRKCQYKKDHERVDPDPRKYKIQLETPSVHSESSWNSQSALLQSTGPRNPPRTTKTNKVHAKSFLAGLGRKYCSCSEQDSVEIQEHIGEISFNKSVNCGVAVPGKASTREAKKTGLNNPRQNLDKLGVGLSKETCFTFPTLNPGARNLQPKLQFQEEVDFRKSIEVFGSSAVEKSNKSLSLEKRLTMLSWDATPRVEEIEFFGATNNDTEIDSDASSDLFEIESVTGKANPFFARQASDATSGCVTPTTCYAPSEASIEWSVVTASAVDFSAMSDYEEQKPSTITSPTKTKTNKEMQQRRRPGMLLGCKSQKSLRVAGDAHIMNNDKANFDPQMRHRTDSSYMPATRFQAETKLASFNSRNNGQHALATRTVLPRASHLFVHSVI